MGGPPAEGGRRAPTTELGRTWEADAGGADSKAGGAPTNVLAAAMPAPVAASPEHDGEQRASHAQ